MSAQFSEAMIQAEAITKSYGSFTAVQDITFTCKKGEVVGFLGPNGAGKTTTMRVLTGYMPPTSGAAYIAGHHTVDDSIAARQRLGYLPETVPLYPEMRVEDYLAFMGRVRHMDNLWPRIDDVLEAVDLLDRAESFVGNLSKGMRQRLGLAQALLHDPDVLILDEPTIGLDPAQIVEIRELITELGRERTVLLSTHILAEVEQICNRVILVINGRIWADMSMDEIQAGGNLLTLRLAAPAADAEQTLTRIEGVEEAQRLTEHEFSVQVDSRDETRIAVAEAVVTQQWGLLEMSQSKISLETIFLNKLKEAQAARPLENEYTDEENHETQSNAD